MPAADLLQTVHDLVERNIGIPAILDAYSQFVDSPIGELELSNLGEVFSAIFENLNSRYPQIASQRAAEKAKDDISNFLSVAGNNPDRVKDVLKSELQAAKPVMTTSIYERFSRANTEEKKAIDATLRLLRRSTSEIMFRVEAGKMISTSGSEFKRFFASVRSESPGMRDLRYQNLIVEKGLFNKLVLKSKNQDYKIWVPSYFAKEDVDALIERTGVVSEHVVYSRMKELADGGQLDQLRPFLSTLIENSGVVGREETVPKALEEFLIPVEEKFVAISPIQLDDISLFLKEEEDAREKQRLSEAAKKLDESSSVEIRRREEEIRQRKRMSQQTVSIQGRQIEQEKRSVDAIYLGKQLDLDQLVSSIGRRASEGELNTDLKAVSDYYTSLSLIRLRGIMIVGSSGSGKSTTLRRLLDGMGSISERIAGNQVILIDQKGEHRGIAWKYKWNVFGFAKDAQAKQYRVPFLLGGLRQEEDVELFANMIQEWCLQIGLGCSNQQRARIASTIRSLGELNPETLLAALLKEQELEQIAKKLSKNLLSPDNASRVFSSEEENVALEGNLLFDISGRGLRNPTTREERLLLSILLLKIFERRKIHGATIVLEDVLDRFKSENLRKNCVEILKKLGKNSNSFIVTSRSQVRDFLGEDCLEIVHRLSGEKTIEEEITHLKLSRTVRNLGGLIAMLPRGYALLSETHDEKGKIVESAAVRVETLQFTSEKNESALPHRTL